MLLHDVFVFPNLVSLAVILGAVTIGVLASLFTDRAAAEAEVKPAPAEADSREAKSDVT
jgi:hypothetical protein